MKIGYGRFLIFWIFVYWDNDKCESNGGNLNRRKRLVESRNVLGMVKYWSSLIQEIVDAKFDPAFDHPSEGSVVVVNNEVDEEGVVVL